MVLTHEQIRLFRHNGYLKLAQCLPAAMVEDLKEEIRRDLRHQVEPVVRSKEGQAVRISKILDRGLLFKEAATYAPLLDVLEGLLGPHIEIVKNRHNHATLNLATGQDASFHRDLVQWSRGLVSVVFFLEETDLENGCTQIVPGTMLHDKT
jgi:phytanoyl-CoA hydroxylase